VARGVLFSISMTMRVMAVVVGVLSVVNVPAAAERPRLRGGESPRATALLRAETLAEQARQRLHLPSRRGGGWEKGGSGWEASPKEKEREKPIILKLPTPRRRPPRE
jgi:hypothetical protein